MRIPFPLKRVGEPFGTNASHGTHLQSLTPIDIDWGIAHPHSGVFFSRGLLRYQSPTVGGIPLRKGDYASPKSWLPNSFAGGLLVESSSLRPAEQLENTDLLFGFFPTNWYHWLINILPKIWAQSARGSNEARNLVVSKSIAAGTFAESLHAALPDSYTLSFVDSRPIAVKNSRFLLSPFPEAPGLRKCSVDESSSLGELCFSCAREYRDFIIRKVAIEIFPDENRDTWVRPSGKRFFLSRGGQSRPTSEVSLYEGLENRGFQIVDPQSLSFSEQVQMFAGAEMIVGVTGAAFAGLLFARQSRVVVMQPSFLGKSVFSELAVVGDNRLETFAYDTREKSWRQYYNGGRPTELNARSFFKMLDRSLSSSGF